MKPGKVGRLDDKKNTMAQGALGERQVAALLSVLQSETRYDEKGYLVGSHARGDYLNPGSQLREEDTVDRDGNKILVHRESEVGNFMHWWTKQVLRDRVKAVRNMAVSIIRQ